MRRLLFACAVSAVACSDPAEPTWHDDVAPIVASRCASCHQDGDIAPFPLTTYDEVVAVRELVAVAVESGTMPPWQAADGCNEYANDSSLPDDQRDLLVAWARGDAREGRDRGADTSAKPAVTFQPDRVLTLPEPYTPTALDDYRCQIVELGVDAPSHVTGFVAMPDQKTIVHHVIAFQIPQDRREAFEAMDAESPDVPGWACYGGPTAPGSTELDVDLSGLSIAELLELFTNGEGIEALGGFGWLGSWAPGGQGGWFPEGTGIAVQPGDFLVVQMHYNTASGAVADQTSVGITLSESVERQALVVPYADPAWVMDLPILGEPMTIPAGEPDVRHDTSMTANGPLFDYVRSRLGQPDNGPLAIHSVAHHMHTLGTTGRQVIERAEGEDTCLLEIPDWDFHWQGRYQLVEPEILEAGDSVRLACSWDNSPGNQPVVDGARMEPQDVQWGEGTNDEMCLGVLYLTAP